MIRWLLPLIGVLALGLLLFVSLGRDTTTLPSPLIDRPVPEFRLPALAGEGEVSPADLKGQAYLLNVWSSYCSGCRIEHPLLNELARRHNVTIVGLNYKDEPGAARNWLERLGNPYKTVALDRDGMVGLDLGVYGTPETFLIDANGIVRHKHVGAITRELVDSLYLQHFSEDAS